MFELMCCESRDQALISILTVNLNLGYRDHAYKINYIHTTSVSDPYQETLIWIRVAPKINQNHGINKSEWFVNVLFT